MSVVHMMEKKVDVLHNTTLKERDMKSLILLHKQEKVEIEATRNTYVTMSQEVYLELQAYVDHYATEVSGCGLVEMIKHEWEEDKEKCKAIEFKIVEVFLPDKQRNTAASTDIPEEALHELLGKLISAGKDTAKLKLHWHSHVNMGVFHSGTDDDNYKTLDNSEWLVSLVLNKQGEILASVDLYEPIAMRLKGLPLYVQVVGDANTINKANESIAKLDKYTEENKSVGFATSTYNPNWVDNDWNDDRWNREIIADKPKVKNLSKKQKQHLHEARAIITECLGITMEQAKVFENCDKGQCHVCSEQCICQQYLYDLSDWDRQRAY